MTTLFSMLIAFVAGGILAMVYLFILRHNLQSFSERQRPGIWLLTGAIMRISIVLTVLFFVFQLGDWGHLMMALGGFILVRWLFLHNILNSHKISSRPVISQ